MSFREIFKSVRVIWGKWYFSCKINVAKRNTMQDSQALFRVVSRNRSIGNKEGPISIQRHVYCTLSLFLNFWNQILYMYQSYLLSHVRFIFPNLKSYLFFMTTPCLTCFGCVPHMASIWVPQNPISNAGTQCEYIIIFVLFSITYYVHIIGCVPFDIIVCLKCYRIFIIHSKKYGTQYM